MPSGEPLWVAFARLNPYAVFHIVAAIVAGVGIEIVRSAMEQHVPGAKISSNIVADRNRSRRHGSPPYNPDPRPFCQTCIDFHCFQPNLPVRPLLPDRRKLRRRIPKSYPKTAPMHLSSTRNRRKMMLTLVQMCNLCQWFHFVPHYVVTGAGYCSTRCSSSSFLPGGKKLASIEFPANSRRCSIVMSNSV